MGKPPREVVVTCSGTPRQQVVEPPALTGCLALGTSSHFSGPQFPHLSNEVNNSTYLEDLRGLKGFMCQVVGQCLAQSRCSINARLCYYPYPCGY